MTESAGTGAELRAWPERLEAACEGTRFLADRVRTFEVCTTTMDVARATGVGAVVAAGRQTAGRGRLGRSWSDADGRGIALSVQVRASETRHIALAIGLAARDAVVGLRPCLDGRVGLKFPNDLVDRRSARKLGGILVESAGTDVTIGLGINVGVRRWSSEVPGISLEEMLDPGMAVPSRIEVLERLVRTLDQWLDRSPVEVTSRFRACHAPTGCHVEIESGSERVVGRLLDLDLERGFLLESRGGTARRIPADTGRIIGWQPREEQDPGTVE